MATRLTWPLAHRRWDKHQGESQLTLIPHRGAARHGSWASLNRLDASVLALDSGLHEHGVAENEDGRRADEPEEDGEGRRDEEHRQANDKEGNVHGLLGDDRVADLERLGACT